VTDVACAGSSTWEDLHVGLVRGQLLYTVRGANGAWSSPVDVEQANKAEIASIISVGMVAKGHDVVFAMHNAAGANPDIGFWTTARSGDGTWDGLHFHGN